MVNGEKGAPYIARPQRSSYVGAVAAAVPRPSLAMTFIITPVGHKDDELAKADAERLAVSSRRWWQECTWTGFNRGRPKCGAFLYPSFIVAGLIRPYLMACVGRDQLCPRQHPHDLVGPQRCLASGLLTRVLRRAVSPGKRGRDRGFFTQWKNVKNYQNIKAIDRRYFWERKAESMRWVTGMPA